LETVFFDKQQINENYGHYLILIRAIKRKKIILLGSRIISKDLSSTGLFCLERILIYEEIRLK
jgi:hypothetical protein